ncbi:MAG: glycine zipper domain-containing protein [Syntrophorhabdaceae bacterium]|nr:glycine zipper domain-containing protein [Syntrophorhabdaceae bacterium]
MKRVFYILSFLMVTVITVSCASTGYNTQKGAAIGAGIGAIGGQIIGKNTASTLIGSAVGALGGAIAGNAIDQFETNQRMVNTDRQRQYTPSSTTTPLTGMDGPPGQWVEVPGQWVAGKWVPAHKAWVPINP